MCSRRIIKGKLNSFSIKISCATFGEKKISLTEVFKEKKPAGLSNSNAKCFG